MFVSPPDVDSNAELTEAERQSQAESVEAERETIALGAVQKRRR